MRYYVVLDLEWNNTYVPKRKSTLNEIIEIGAVLLDQDFQQVDCFRQFIKASLGKKLHGRVVRLTSICDADINSGIPFTQVMSDFRKWLNGRECVILTWGNTDIRVLMENFQYFSGAKTIPFLKYYLDLQQYVQDRLQLSNRQQLGLQAAAELLQIPTGDLVPHRALSDSIVAARCLLSLGHCPDDRETLEGQVRCCDKDFYARMQFKPYYITDLQSGQIKPELLRCRCPYCDCQMKQIKHFVRKNQSLRGVFYCGLCANEYRYTLRLKQKYDGLEVRKRLEFAEPPAPPAASAVYQQAKQC